MKTLIVALVLVAGAFCNVAAVYAQTAAQNAPTASATALDAARKAMSDPAAQSPAQARLVGCRDEWRNRTDTTVSGSAAYNAYVRACIVEHGGKVRPQRRAAAQ